MRKTLFFWLLLLTNSQLINKKFAKRTGTGLGKIYSIKTVKSMSIIGLIPVQLKREILLSRSLLRKMPQTKNSGNSHLVFDCYFQVNNNSERIINLNYSSHFFRRSSEKWLVLILQNFKQELLLNRKNKIFNTRFSFILWASKYCCVLIFLFFLHIRFENKLDSKKISVRG